MVVPAGGPQEDRSAAHLGADDLEAEDAPVEVDGDVRVADPQDGVVEAGDGDAHGAECATDGVDGATAQADDGASARAGSDGSRNGRRGTILGW